MSVLSYIGSEMDTDHQTTQTTTHRNKNGNTSFIVHIHICLRGKDKDPMCGLFCAYMTCVYFKQWLPLFTLRYTDMVTHKEKKLWQMGLRLYRAILHDDSLV